MTKEEMNQLADLITDRVLIGIRKLQNELDEDMQRQLDDISTAQDLNIKSFNVQDEVVDDAKEWLLSQLEGNLQEALDREDYDQAAEIVHKINDLKR